MILRLGQETVDTGAPAISGFAALRWVAIVGGLLLIVPAIWRAFK